jgi:hypothetical protein
LTNPRSQDDLFLLDFMAERAVENANSNGQGAAHASMKSEARRMNTLALNSGCFRKDLQRALLGERTKQPWSIRILEGLRQATARHGRHFRAATGALGSGVPRWLRGRVVPTVN